MQKTDKFLIAIVAGTILLVIAAFALALNRPETSYREGDSPEAAAHNYLLALERNDHNRAHGYLSPNLSHYPATSADFSREVSDSPWRFRESGEATLAVQDADIQGTRATVKVYETRFSGGSFFESNQSSYAFDMELEQIDGEWKIIDSPYYFAWCWAHGDGCD